MTKPVENHNTSALPLAVSANFGFSPFTGGYGLEFQASHFALELSNFTINTKYYFKPFEDSMFVGIYKANDFNSNEDDSHTDNFIDDMFDSYYRKWGIGMGYTWQWESGVRFSLSSAVGLGSPARVEEENSSRFQFGFTFGYQF